MNDRFLYSGSMFLGTLALVLLLVNVCLVNSNRNLQMELGARANLITNSNTQSQINNALVQALAQASVNDDDKDARDLLSAQGISVKAKQPAAAAAATTTPTEKKK